MSVDRILKGHDLFRSLSVDEAHSIADISSVKMFDEDETVFNYDDPAAHVYMLMDGAVDLLLPAKSEHFNLIVSKIEIGELFGLSPLLDSQRYTASALCREQTELLSIEATPFRELIRGNSLAGFDMMNRVAHIYFNRYIDVLKSLQGVVNQVSLIR
jgi:signal-transduction protein with cAMP-binding, CBS, and nucleotidyltransferase domain